MNYSALIQNRKSVREFTDKQISFSDLEILKNYYENQVRRLIPELKTQLHFFGTDARAALEGAAGYNQFLVGAPQYLVLLSEKHDLAELNAGYIMEDLVLKLTDMDLNTCWLTFADSEDIKKAMLAKDKVALDALRGIKKEFLEAKTAKGGDGELHDDRALQILQKSFEKNSKENTSGLFVAMYIT